MSRHLTVTRMCAMPYDACQSFLSVFTQMSPAEDTFGWKIFVANQPNHRSTCEHMEAPAAENAGRAYVHFGGAAGNSSVKLNLTLK